MLKNNLLKKSSFVIKMFIVLSSIGGVILSLFYAEFDGYSHWAVRLMYFTGLSNIWIGFCVAIILISPYIKAFSTEEGKRRLYVLRYIFTVSITVTGIVYCFILAPFAEEAQFVPWTAPSVLTHVIAPLLSLVDFFLDEYKIRLNKTHVVLCAIPPLCYFTFAGILNILDVDFGKGETYPYFFLNLKSPAGIFGFSDTPPFVMGSFYWIVLFLLIIFTIAAPYAVLTSIILDKRDKKTSL